jgi:hypothetical protein
MNIKTESRSFALFLICLISFAPKVIFGAGLAAIKEQTFHHDAGAKIVVYDTIKVSAISVQIITPQKEFFIEPRMLAGSIEVLSALPSSITSDTELEPVRNAAKQYSDFATRFPKSAPILASHISALGDCIKNFESGNGRYNGVWMPKAEALTAKKKNEETPSPADVALKKRLEERQEFEKSQKAKGLTEINGKWLTKNEIENLKTEAEAHEKANKYLEMVNVYTDQIKTEKLSINEERKKLPLVEVQLFQQGKTRKEVDAEIKSKTSSLAIAERILDTRLELLAWLRLKAASMHTKGIDDDQINRLVESVMKNQIFVGMDSETVRASWGKPNTVNTFTTATGQTEQWVYGSLESKFSFLSFEHDKLVSISN